VICIQTFDTANLYALNCIKKKEIFVNASPCMHLNKKTKREYGFERERVKRDIRYTRGVDNISKFFASLWDMFRASPSR